MTKKTNLAKQKISQKARTHKENIKAKANGKAHKTMSDEFFYDYARRKHHIYWINLIRGLFFGFGTVLGGTLLIAMLIWLLSQLIDIPVIGDTVRQTIDTIQSGR